MIENFRCAVALCTLQGAYLVLEKFRTRLLSNKFGCYCEFAVKLGPKFSETVKGKLSLGAKIIRKGGRENIFRQIFSVSDGEQLLKASQCYLSTTAGPIAGILFISTEKVAFCSERPVTLSACPGGVVRTPYKVIINYTTSKQIPQL